MDIKKNGICINSSYSYSFDKERMKLYICNGRYNERLFDSYSVHLDFGKFEEDLKSKFIVFEKVSVMLVDIDEALGIHNLNPKEEKISPNIEEFNVFYKSLP